MCCWRLELAGGSGAESCVVTVNTGVVGEVMRTRKLYDFQDAFSR